METKQKVIFSSLFLLLGIFSFLVGAWFGGLWIGSFTESGMFISNGELHDKLFECGIIGDTECFKDEYSFFAYHNTVYATMLIDKDITGFITEELQKRIDTYNQQIDRLR